MIPSAHHRSLPVLLKWLGLVPVLLTYLGISAFISVIPLSGRARRVCRIRNTTFFSRIALAVFNVRVRMHHHARLIGTIGHGRLVIANHLSYIDVLALSAASPAVFITSVEMKHTPLLGMLARFGGSLFVERRKRSGLKREIDEIAGVLAQGFLVVLFAEGTTSNGDHVHPFKRSLFDAAIASKSEILPVCLRYSHINHEPITAANREALYYYGGTSFADHFPAFLTLRSVALDIFPLIAIPITPGITRRELASWTHDAITGAYCAGAETGSQP